MCVRGTKKRGECILSGSSSSSADECDLIIQRLGGWGGELNAIVKISKTSEVVEGNVCSGRMTDNLELTKDLNIITDGVQSISTSSITFSWPHHNAEDKCIKFNIIDDGNAESDESLCLHIEQVDGTGKLSETGDVYTLVTVSDNDQSQQTGLIISISVPAFFLLVALAYGYVRRQKQSYIPIRYAVEIEKCDVDKCVEIIHDLLPKHMRKQNTEKQKVMLSKLNSSCLPNELKIREEECKELRSAWHYLVTTKNVKCVEITRDFLKSHKKLVGTLANLTDETGRKAIHVALLAQRKEIENFLFLCGRYRINTGPVVHRSKTSEVVFAIDVKDTSEYKDGK